jgi:hypothetical protein
MGLLLSRLDVANGCCRVGDGDALNSDDLFAASAQLAQGFDLALSARTSARALVCLAAARRTEDRPPTGCTGRSRSLVARRLQRRARFAVCYRSRQGSVMSDALGRLWTASVRGPVATMWHLLAQQKSREAAALRRDARQRCAGLGTFRVTQRAFLGIQNQRAQHRLFQFTRPAGAMDHLASCWRAPIAHSSHRTYFHR